jgi:hypothetical protein
MYVHSFFINHPDPSAWPDPRLHRAVAVLTASTKPVTPTLDVKRYGFYDHQRNLYCFNALALSLTIILRDQDDELALGSLAREVFDEHIRPALQPLLKFLGHFPDQHDDRVFEDVLNILEGFQDAVW